MYILLRRIVESNLNAINNKTESLLPTNDNGNSG